MRRTLKASDWSPHFGFWEWDPATDRLRWLNDWWRSNALDLSAATPGSEALRAIVEPGHWPAVVDAWERHARGERDRFEAECRLRTTAGEWRWFAVKGHLVERDADGAPRRMLGAAFDIDRRKRVELGRVRRLRQFEAAAAGARAWVIVVDLEMRIEFLNRAIRGVPPVRALGRPLADLVGPEEAARFARYAEAVVRQQRVRQYRSVIDDGSRVLEARIAPVYEDDRVIGVVSLVNEVTDRIALERAVLEIADRERRRLGADLHDGLGQELTGIALTLKTLLLRAEQEQSALADDVAEALALVNDAIGASRRLARGLSPVAPETGGLAHALRELGRRLGGADGVHIGCDVVEQLPAELDPDVADHLYRIAQEGVNNALRHAGASRITVSLDYDRAERRLRLEVADDGRGLDPSAELGPGLGLKIMRYRSEVIGGWLQLLNAADGGTRVVVTCHVNGVGGPNGLELPADAD